MFGKQEYAKTNALLDRRLKEKKHLIAVHRGSYTGNITQNTIPAYIAAIRMGADMVVGCELIAATPEDELFADEAIAYVHSKGLYCWANAIELGELRADYTPYPRLYGGLNDDISIIEGPEKGWGRLMEKGVDVIQTDWPALLHAYRDEALRGCRP